jgi:cell division protein FtsB
VKKKLLRYVPHFLRNRYGAGVFVFLFWITFMHDYDLYTTLKLRRELHRMREQHDWYAQEIQRSKEQLHELNSNATLKEKFARETYLMKRDNEQIFVLVPEKQ